MALAPKLELRQGQQLVMTPQLQQAIRLLQLSNVELCYVRRGRARAQSAAGARRGRAGAVPRARSRRARRRRPASGDDDWSEPRSAAAAQRRRRTTTATRPRTSTATARSGRRGQAAGRRCGRARTMRLGGEDTNLEDFVAAGRSLADHLTEQLHLAITDPAERLIGAHLIHMVDEAGYLHGDLDDLADKLGAPASSDREGAGPAAGLRSARRVRARPGGMPGAAAQGPEPLRSADRQAARQPGPARQPQPRGA